MMNSSAKARDIREASNSDCRFSSCQSNLFFFLVFPIKLLTTSNVHLHSLSHRCSNFAVLDELEWITAPRFGPFAKMVPINLEFRQKKHRNFLFCTGRTGQHCASFGNYQLLKILNLNMVRRSVRVKPKMSV